jgi:hypothetical protein
VVSVVFATLAINTCVCDAPRDTVLGSSDTVTASVREMVELAEADGLATLVAVTVTVWAALIEAGAV